MYLLALCCLTYTTDASASHITVGIETAHIFLERQTVAVTIFYTEERESPHNLHIGVRQAGHELIGTRTFLAHLVKRFQKMFFPSGSIADWKIFGHTCRKMVNSIAKQLLVKLFRTIVYTRCIKIEIRGKHATVRSENIASRRHYDLALREKLVGSVIPLVGINYGSVA